MLSKQTRLGMSRFSVVVPVLNDREYLGQLISTLAPFSELELIVVDGGSSDRPEEVVGPAKFLQATSRGRGAQIATGINHTSRDWIWVLHADSVVNEAILENIVHATHHSQWGRFDVKLMGTRWQFRVIETFMNLRSRLTGICTGDQGMFFHRALLSKIGGFPDQPLMEDVEVSKRLRKLTRPYCSSSELGTSTRKWESGGLLRTVFRMWGYRLRYFLGTSSHALYQEYYS